MTPSLAAFINSLLLGLFIVVIPVGTAVFLVSQSDYFLSHQSLTLFLSEPNSDDDTAAWTASALFVYSEEVYTILAGIWSTGTSGLSD